MRAYRMVSKQGAAEWQQVERPQPGPGEILIETVAAGLCRTDLEMMDRGARYYRWTGPYTIGHETSGRVAQLGELVTRFEVGDAVLVHSNSSCGKCANCLAGRDAFCLDKPPNYGYGADGGLAPYMKARQRDVLHLRTLDPRTAAPLADAGATAYGALLRCRPFIADDGFVVVVGIGGVGSLAVQLLRALTSARVIAVDLPGRLELAQVSGAHEAVAAGAGAAAEIKRITGSRGADATIDIVGSDETLRLAADITASLGAIAVVGLSGGSYPFSMASQRMGTQVFSSTTCSLAELARLITLAERGLVSVEHQSFDFADVEQAYDALRRGTVAGRPVITFAN